MVDDMTGRFSIYSGDDIIEENSGSSRVDGSGERNYTQPLIWLLQPELDPTSRFLPSREYFAADEL
jgi:hypothetical protein